MAAPTRRRVMAGIVVRGEGGYVVAPTSLHPSGATYRLVEPASGAILDRLPGSALPRVPEWLRRLARLEASRRVEPLKRRAAPARRSA